MRLNPFYGKGTYAKFSKAIYSRLMKREWFELADVMADHLKLKSSDDLPYGVSKCDHYGELKKAFRDLKNLLEEIIGDKCVESKGNNRKKKYRYTGSLDNPLEDLQNAQAINNIQIYAQFCIDSAGFFPTCWMEYFLEDTLDLLRITSRKKSGEQAIISSADRELTNIELLPLLYDAIRSKVILNIDYKSVGKFKSLEIHPHILKEYNGRWFLFGYVKGEKPEMAHNLALDRIIRVKSVKGKEYMSAPTNYYADYFKDIIGVSHGAEEAIDIVFRARNFRMFNLIETKKMHSSQKTIKPYGEYDGVKYGEFQIHVEVNNEFIGRILQMGAGLEVISPKEVRELFRTRTTNLADLYRD